MGLFMVQSQLFDMNLYGEELQATHSDTLLSSYYPVGIGTEPAQASPSHQLSIRSHVVLLETT